MSRSIAPCLRMVLHKYSGKVSICLDTINVTEMRFRTTEELGHKWDIINGRDISIDSVCGNWLIVTMDIESREWGLLSINYISSDPSRAWKLSGSLEIALNSQIGAPRKYSMYAWKLWLLGSIWCWLIAMTGCNSSLIGLVSGWKVVLTLTGIGRALSIGSGAGRGASWSENLGSQSMSEVKTIWGSVSHSWLENGQMGR